MKPKRCLDCPTLIRATSLARGGRVPDRCAKCSLRHRLKIAREYNREKRAGQREPVRIRRDDGGRQLAQARAAQKRRAENAEYARLARIAYERKCAAAREQQETPA